MIFLINFLIIIIYHFLTRLFFRKKEISDNVFFCLAFLHVLIFRIVTCPSQIEDVNRYIDAFYIISDQSFNESVLSVNYYSSWGQGYVFYNWIIAKFFQSSFWLFSLSSVIAVGGVLLIYKRTSYNITISILMFLIYPMMYYMGFGVIRQHIAVVFVLLALYYYDDMYKRVFYTILAFLFHYSAIIFFPFFIWNRYFRNYFSSAMFYVISACIVLLIRISLYSTLSFFPRYQEVFEEGEKTNNFVPFVLLAMMSVILLRSGFFKRTKKIIDYNIASFVIYGSFISLFSLRMPGAGRLTVFNLYALPIVITYFYQEVKHKRINAQIYLAFFIFLSVYLYISSGVLSDYHYFWEKVDF